MSLILNGTLQTAQNGQSHKPIIDLNSISAVADFPMVGSPINVSATDEKHQKAITLASGRLALVYTYGTILRYVYTDIDRTQFYEVDLTPLAGRVPTEATLCELINGNVGIVYHAVYGSYQQLIKLILSPIGVIVPGSHTVILSQTTATHVLSAPYLLRLSNDNYLLVYVDKTITGPSYDFRQIISTDFDFDEGSTSILNDANRIDNPSLIQLLTSGQIWLWYDRVDSVIGSNELNNIYYMTSDDNGGTWSAGTKHTAYTTYDTIGTHPIAAQKIATQMYLVFNEIMGVITLDTTAPNWDATNLVWSLQIDDVLRKMYAVVHRSDAYGKYLAIVKIDMATWTVDKTWNATSVPAIPPNWDTSQNILPIPSKSRGERHLIPIACSGGGFGPAMHILLLDGNADTIFEYHFESHPTWTPPVVKNVDFTTNCDQIHQVWIDYGTDRMYILLTKYVGGYNGWYHLGYFDLTETGETKTFISIVEKNDIPHGEMAYNIYNLTKLPGSNWVGIMEIVPSMGWCILYIGGTFTEFGKGIGRTRIHLLSDGTLFKEYIHGHTEGYFPNYPGSGICKGRCINGKIWGIYPYIASDTEYVSENWDGLCSIDPTTDTIIHYRPPWSPAGHHPFSHMDFTDDFTKLIFNELYAGIAVYEISTSTWVLYTNDNVPGLTPGLDPCDLLYDDTAGMIYLGGRFDKQNINGVLGFSVYGSLKTSVYQIRTYSGGVWNWGTLADFCQGLSDYDAVITLDPEDQSMFVFWTEKEALEYSLLWNKENATLSLNTYLYTGVEISVNRRIDGTPSELHFAVSKGHLFDIHNFSSLLSPYLKKGRRLVLKFGEHIAGEDFLQDQGTFMVVETQIQYTRGSYPIMNVVAKDRRCYWDYADIFATTFYQNYPEDILIGVLEDFLDFDPDTEIDPALNFGDSELIYQQWVGVKAKDLIEQICHRFFSFPRITVTDQFSVRKIGNDNTVDHIYANTSKLIAFTPDDSFSDFTNRITVVGYGRTDFAVTYAEERVGTLHGTCGWWGFNKDFNVYYSTDKSRVCISPRLVVLESSQSIAFQLAGQVHEEISLVDPLNLYCVVTVTAPNLIPMLIAGIAIYLVGSYFGDLVFAAGFIANVGWTTPVGRRIEQIGLLIVMMVLSAIGNFQYEIWAKPKGYVKMSMQATANDPVLQQEIDAIVTQKFEDPLAYTMEVCQKVADFELMIAKNQRKRIKFTKIMHLQDEEGDSITIPHPYSGSIMKIFITDLIRRIKIPDTVGGDGYALDEIQGWDITA